MNKFELNKILAAFLCVGIFMWLINAATDAIFAPEKLDKPAISISVPTQTSQPLPPVQTVPPIAPLLANADAARGQNDAKVCQSCHTFDKGGHAGVGPNLWGIVGRPRASVPGFTYSNAMTNKGGAWTVEDLNQFLANPQSFVPGTRMPFSGIPKPNVRADVIAYLNSLSDNPAPLPTAGVSTGGQPGP